MKKNILLLSLLISVTLTACSTKEPEPTNVAAEETVEMQAESEVTKQETEEPQEVSIPEADQVEAVEEYYKGHSDEKGFESGWIGLRFTAPEGTTMLTEKELNEAMNMSEEDLLKDSAELQKIYADMTSITEMMCYVKEIAPSVVVSTYKVADNITDEQYLKSVEDSLAKVTTMTYTIIKDTEMASIGGIDFRVLNTKAEYDNQVIFQNYYVMHKGNHVVTITSTYTEATQAELDAMMSAFEAY